MRFQFIPAGTSVVVHTNNGGRTLPITLSRSFVDTYPLDSDDLYRSIDSSRISWIDIVGDEPAGVITY